jgi:putative transposase
MSRVARIVIPGFAHHGTQRGNRRADVFYSDDDRRAYLRFLRQYTERHGLAVWAYCLMTNHAHLVAVPQREDSLTKALRDTHTVYAMRLNNHHPTIRPRLARPAAPCIQTFVAAAPCQ